MSFILNDVRGILLALPAIFAITLLPGRLLSILFDFPGCRDPEGWLQRACVWLLVGAATMPVLLDLAGHAGPSAMTGGAIALSIAGLFWPGAIRGASRPSRLAVAAFAIWVLLAIALLVDWPDGDGLHRSMQSADHVKHSAATWAIAQSGTPPFNPTFFEPGAKSAYYYFFYNLTATTQLLTAALGVEARQAAWAGVIFAGVLLFAFAHLVYKRSGFDTRLDTSRPGKLCSWLLALLATTGLDILPVVLVGGIIFHTWISDFEFWDTQVTSWLNSVIWVPHHITALATAWVGFLALSNEARGGASNWRRAVLAGLAFASCAGLSIYVAFGAALTALAFVIWLAIDRRGADIARWALAGFVAALFAGPWLISLIAGRPVGPGEAPIAFEIRAVPILDLFVTAQPWRGIGRLLTLPIAYSIEFGVYLLGSICFWKRWGSKGFDGDVAKLLVVSLCVSFLVGTFLRSTVLLNDLGWRIMLFAQLSMLVWTLAAIRGGLFKPIAQGGHAGRREALIACIALGFCADIYGFVQMRRYVEETPAETAMAPDERAAWEWMSNNLQPKTIVEENPDRPRSFAYGLYGHFRASVADHYNGILFGSSKDAVEQRIRDLKPLFTDSELNAEDAAAIATKASIDVVVIRSLDPVFTAPNGWPNAVTPIYENPHMRVIRIIPRAFADRAP